MENKTLSPIDFNDTSIAFAHKSNDALKKAVWLFGLMNRSWLVGFGSRVGVFALRLGLPVPPIIKTTIFEHFCGGTSLDECTKVIKKLYEYNILGILDYGAEAKKTESDFNATMRETMRALEFAATHQSVPVVSCKLTGLARFALLEKAQSKNAFNKEEEEEYYRVIDRIDAICRTAHENKVGVFIDAEESWIQDTIDRIANMMMRRYNKERVSVYNTFQFYRHDRLQYLKDSFEMANKEGYLLGAKLVRGAYMDKEHERARRYGYPTPIQANKAATDDDFNAAIKFCVERYQEIASCNATHNQYSCLYEVELIEKFNLPRDHKHLNFCQLLGMSDNLSFNLAKSGYNVAKYLPYGPVRDVIPYLIRRAKENTSVTGDMSRELGFLKQEVKRRGLE